MNMEHVINPRATRSRFHVHLRRPNTDVTLCDTPMWRDFEGVPVQNLLTTSKDVTCRKCRMTLEVGMRERLNLLTTKQLEEILEVTNGHLWEDAA